MIALPLKDFELKIDMEIPKPSSIQNLSVHLMVCREAKCLAPAAVGHELSSRGDCSRAGVTR